MNSALLAALAGGTALLGWAHLCATRTAERGFIGFRAGMRRALLCPLDEHGSCLYRLRSGRCPNGICCVDSDE